MVYVPLWRLWPLQSYLTVSYPDELALQIRLPLDFIRLGGDNTLRFVQDVAQMLVEGEGVLRDSANIDEALDLEDEPKEALYSFVPGASRLRSSVHFVLTTLTTQRTLESPSKRRAVPKAHTRLAAHRPATSSRMTGRRVSPLARRMIRRVDRQKF